MDEFITPHSRATELHTAHTPELVRAAVETEKWHALTPNLYSPGYDLLPQKLTAEHINTLVEAILKDPILASIHKDRNAEEVAAEVSKEPIDLGEAGALTFVGGGEAKVCYCLERDGEKMAVILQGYAGELGVQIPDDPHLTKINIAPTMNTWEYSDLRTYAVIPFARNSAIKLQEFGEHAQHRFMSAGRSITGAFIRRRAVRYIAQRLPGARLGPGTNTASELAKPDHTLTKPSHSRSALIDIPVIEERTS